MLNHFLAGTSTSSSHK